MLRISAATQLAVTGPVMGKCAFPRAMLTILGYYVARRAEWCKLSKLASTWRASPAELRHLQSLSNCDEFWLTSVCANARALHIREGGQSSAVQPCCLFWPLEPQRSPPTTQWETIH
eukprot:TRINITY_DN13778_c0_g1_i2.p1 TRINITY_DN13778_c0_g1~~TRINITY_DN13778_c0_g1_i2.p1  ORF type:complete len:117 (-),score=1.85 TRINITY_DN13778_c0_g1_i2:69-419(-)